MKRTMKDIKAEGRAKRQRMLQEFERLGITQERYGIMYGLKVWRINKILLKAKKERDSTVTAIGG